MESRPQNSEFRQIIMASLNHFQLFYKQFTIKNLILLISLGNIASYKICNIKLRILKILNFHPCIMSFVRIMLLFLVTINS